MTTPHVHCMSNLPTAHEPHTSDAAEGDDEPLLADGPSDPASVSPSVPASGDEWGDGRVPARVAPMSLCPLG